MRFLTQQPRRLLLTRRLYHDHTALLNRRKAIKYHGAPESIHDIADNIDDVGNRSVLIRPIGSCRRVALLEPHLTPRECEGLAYRLQILKRNKSLSSVLIVSDDRENYDLNQQGRDNHHYSQGGSGEIQMPAGFMSTSDFTWYVAGGYDPATLTKETKGPMLHHLSSLARAVRGDDEKASKIPFLFMPNGAITDGGAAFMLSSYVLVSENSSYAILNPSRGLALDPTGMSWLLPRLGQEFKQPSAKCSAGCALILALMGYEADYKDMVYTGLATHCLSSPANAEDIEAFLAETPAWEQQAILKEPKRYQGATAKATDPHIYDPDYDHNAEYRNVQVAELVSAASSFSADGVDITLGPNDETVYDMFDPSLDAESDESITDVGVQESNLVNYALTFQDIFYREKSVEGILERFKELSNSSDTSIDQEVKDIAADFTRRIERQSPLALCCTYRLLWLGAGKQETLESCMQREQTAQMKLLQSQDFLSWQDAKRKAGPGANEPLSGVKWQYDHVSKVPIDHVAEILRETG